jgi:large subunit ribosomal protein L29
MAKKTKKTRISGFRDMSPDELGREESELRDAIWKLRLQKSTGQAQDPHRLAATKRDLARLLTVRRERETTREAGRRS